MSRAGSSVGRLAARAAVHRVSARVGSFSTSASYSAVATVPDDAKQPKQPLQLEGRRSGGFNGRHPARNLAYELLALKKVKQDNKPPSPREYLSVMTAAAEYSGRRGLNRHSGVDDVVSTVVEPSLGLDVALAAWRDAEKSGVNLGTDAFDVLLKFSFVHPEIVPSVLLTLSENGIATAATYNTLAAEAISRANLEKLVLVLIEMLEQEIVPSSYLVSHAIRVACEGDCPRLALQLAERIEAMPGADRVPSGSWVNILSASASNQYLEGVLEAWTRCVTNRAYTPDEGLILAVLSVAGRWGKTELATAAIAQLPEINVCPREEHFAPLVAAFCVEGRVPEALEMLGKIRAAGINPGRTTSTPVEALLSTPELLDQAFYTLEDMYAAGKPVDVTALNAVVRAAEVAEDLVRARATQLAAKDLGVEPDVETFNSVLRAAVTAKHRSLGNSVLADLSAAGVQPDEHTYDAMIRLCLTQPEYDDAFYYLEKMKSAGFKPTRRLYQGIANKCSYAGDGRWKLVADEAQTLGFTIRGPTETADRRASRFGDGGWSGGARGARNTGGASFSWPRTSPVDK